MSHTAWSKRAVAHPEVFGVLAAGKVSESFARTVCIWTDNLPARSRDAPDGILMAAAVSGLGLRDLAVLASEMLARCWQPGRQAGRQDPARGPQDQRGRPEDELHGAPDGDRPGADGDDGTGEDPVGQPGDGGNGRPGEDPDGRPGGLGGDGAPDGVFADRALRLLVTSQVPGCCTGSCPRSARRS